MVYQQRGNMNFIKKYIGETSNLTEQMKKWSKNMHKKIGIKQQQGSQSHRYLKV
jgi:hypothetical protein